MVYPQKEPVKVEIECTLDSYQNIVGGLIECIYPFDDENLVLVCHEEGKLEVPILHNRTLYYTNSQGEKEMYDIIAGTFFACSIDDEDDFASLTPEHEATVMERFGKPEYFIS